LEAGTGHGSLTLHLARAIHAANSARPTIPAPPRAPKALKRESCVEQDDSVTLTQEEVEAAAVVAEKKLQEAEIAHAKSKAVWDSWKSSRHGIIHTLDISGPNSKAAQKIVRGFKNGIYYGNVDFHIGKLKDFFERRGTVASTSASTSANGSGSDEPNAIDPTAKETISADEDTAKSTPNFTPTTQPFLSHVILDLPSAHLQLPVVTPHIHVSGKVLLFVPSITQIVDAVETVKSLNLPLSLDKVLELGPGISAGREWDVKAVKIRANEKRLKLEGVDGEGDREIEVRTTTEKEYGIVCRPKVGVTVIGGGFLGVWSKMRKEGDGIV
jgi:hypothetical protein